ncbi:MAG: hypothetical protein OXC69_10815 [Candidatus Tectomicrobia bacterium]|nr:hypothetical protein [Candidatus Tectomicrobia bacterium]
MGYIRLAALTATFILANWAHGQQLPTKYTVMEWVDNSDTSLQTCLAQSTDVGDYHAILDGRIYVEDDSYDQENPPYEAVYFSYTDHTGSHRDQITLHHRNEGEIYPNKWFDFLDIHPDWYIDVGDLAHTIEADSVTLEFVSTAQTAIWYNVEAIVDLVFSQWLDHWCLDEDNDTHCDYFTTAEGERHLPIPSMRAAEQVDVAQCLNSHRNTKVVVAKLDFQISGAANYPAIAQWTTDCPVVPETVVPTPAKTGSLSTSESCRLFQSWILGKEVPGYLCDPAMSPEDSELSGRQIRYRMDKAIGEFPGFSCPTVDTASSNPLTSEDLRFDTLPLNEMLQRRLPTHNREVKLRALEDY